MFFNWRRKIQAPPGLIASGAKLEKLASGFRFVEGPLWIGAENCLLFSDIPANRIYKWRENRGVEVFLEPSRKANGLALDEQGRVIICQHQARRVSRLEAGVESVLAQTFEGKKLNSPNDVVVKKGGAIYFSDPPGGIEKSEQEQPIQGVYRLSPSGVLQVVAGDFAYPNGLAFSPDEKILYIADSSPLSHIRAFDVAEDGTLSGNRLFCVLPAGKEKSASPDGMKVDAMGRVYCAARGGVWVFDATGNHLGTLATPEQPANCAWGETDRKTLFITARTSVYRIRLNIAGAGMPRSGVLQTD